MIDMLSSFTLRRIAGSTARDGKESVDHSTM